MELEFSQEVVSSLEDFTNQITFIFCMPYSEYIYAYGINSIDNLHYIDRIELNGILTKISNSYFRTDFLTSHFRKFIYIKDKKEFIELSEDQEFGDITSLIKEQLVVSTEKVIVTSNPINRVMNSVKSVLHRKAHLG